MLSLILGSKYLNLRGRTNRLEETTAVMLLILLIVFITNTQVNFSFNFKIVFQLYCWLCSPCLLEQIKSLECPFSVSYLLRLTVKLTDFLQFIPSVSGKAWSSYILSFCYMHGTHRYNYTNYEKARWNDDNRVDFYQVLTVLLWYISFFLVGASVSLFSIVLLPYSSLFLHMGSIDAL